MNARAGFLFAAAAAVLFLGAVSPVPAPSALFQLNCSKSESVKECFKRWFYDVEEFTDDDSEKLFAALDAAEWVGLDGDNAADCQKVLDGVNEAYYGGGVDLYTGMPNWQAQDSAASQGIVIAGHLPHPDGAAILFHSSLLDFEHDLLTSALHEAAHYAGIGHDDEFSSYDAQDCAKIPNEEDDEDDPGEGGTVTTCTDEPYTYKEWDWVWTEIEAGSCVGVSPVALPGEEPGEPELHCTPAVWGYVLMEVEKEGVRTVCVTTSN